MKSTFLGSFRQVAELKVIISPIPTEAESSLELRFERYNFPHLWRTEWMGLGAGEFGYTRGWVEFTAVDNL